MVALVRVGLEASVASRLAVLVIEMFERTSRNKVELPSSAIQKPAASNGRVQEGKRSATADTFAFLSLPHLLEAELELRAVEHVELPHPGAEGVPERQTPPRVVVVA